MTLRAYSIRDSKSESYNTPFFQTTHGEAERTFRTAVNDPKTQLSMYPEDFHLYYLGDFDSEQGTIVPEDAPKHMLHAVHCVKNQLTPQPEVAEQ